MPRQRQHLPGVCHHVQERATRERGAPPEPRSSAAAAAPVLGPPVTVEGRPPHERRTKVVGGARRGRERPVVRGLRVHTVCHIFTVGRLPRVAKRFVPRPEPQHLGSAPPHLKLEQLRLSCCSLSSCTVGCTSCSPTAPTTGGGEPGE